MEVLTPNLPNHERKGMGEVRGLWSPLCLTSLGGGREWTEKKHISAC